MLPLGFGMDMDMFWGVAGIVGGVASVVALVWVAAKGHADRAEEDAARAFYDVHGHWPDQEPGEAR